MREDGNESERGKVLVEYNFIGQIGNGISDKKGGSEIIIYGFQWQYVNRIPITLYKMSRYMTFRDRLTSRKFSQRHKNVVSC